MEASFQEYIQQRIKTLRFATGLQDLGKQLDALDSKIIEYYQGDKGEEKSIVEFTRHFFPLVCKLSGDDLHMVASLVDYISLFKNEIKFYEKNKDRLVETTKID